MLAGQINQGQNSIAIGTNSGLNNQHVNSIIINSTGNVINTLTPNAFYVAPIRSSAAGKGVNVLFYNPLTSEIMYSTT